jgi:glycerol uptake facilitator-like aquaporin
MRLRTRFLGEFIGSAFLLMIVVGSGIMGERLSQGNAAIALLVNSIATGAGLFAIIQSIGPLSGAHFNPAVSLAERLWGRMDSKTLAIYWSAQLLGALLGVLLAHAMFDLSLFQISTKVRTGMNLGISELVATFGLIATIALAGRRSSEFLPLSIAAYITSAYWFTSSTAFANPAVTIARAFTETFCGIAPESSPQFLGAQLLGSLLAIGALYPIRAKG